MYDIGPPGLRSAGSTLKFFKTHHLKCSLQVTLRSQLISNWFFDTKLPVEFVCVCVGNSNLLFVLNKNCQYLYFQIQTSNVTQCCTKYFTKAKKSSPLQ